MEGENPTRRYKWFRPRQAAQTGGGITPTNFGAVGLFNDSIGDRVLVVRSIRATSDGVNIEAQTYNLHGHLSTIQAGQIPVMSSTPQIPGTLYMQDLASLPSNLGYQFSAVINGDSYWPHDFPFAVIEPGWSLVAVNEQQGKSTTVSFMWEAIYIEELDFFW